MKKFALIASLFTVSACSSAAQTTSTELRVTSLFVEQNRSVFPNEARNRKGWDAPTIADLDQDGFPDVLINDHGYGLRVMWNNRGVFAPPFDILMGDLHGVSVGDLDGDGTYELVVSRGGGAGSNARNSKIFTIDETRSFVPWDNFDTPLVNMRGRTVKFVDLDKDGDLDLLNFAFPTRDLREKGQSENYIYENTGGGELVLRSVLPMSQGDGQKTLITDMNNDGFVDLLLYGHGKLKVYQGKSEFRFDDVTSNVLTKPINDVTGVAELDYDNDGDFDIVISRGLPFEKGETFYDASSKLLGFYTKRGPFDFGDIPIGDTLLIENYQSPWPEQLPYIAEPGYKLPYEGELHSGRTISLVSSDALGYPDKTRDQKGVYIGYVGNQNWRFTGNIFSPFSGVIHNVMNYPAYDHKPGLNDILLENKGDHFVDVSASAGLSAPEHTTGLAVGDLDNNGFVDLVFFRRGNLISPNHAIVYLNTARTDGSREYKALTQHGVVSNELGASGMGGDVIDYNLDGNLDLVVGNERGQWHLFKNHQQNDNRYVQVEVQPSPDAQASPKGAVVTVVSCGMTQQKRVGATGANYSTNFDTSLHFGLGQCNKTPKIDIHWTNGEVRQD
ncbi:CRTAC1 family protein [Alteromonas sp. KUL49]|uniref:CRTAC1 family protein n=1 Tax=Alteromonas sp. KUL49 TaxID=2480798 RepID=UPI00102F023A|nr:CRTAC1 family protein [Alteromonas sp. KUL49]TAP33816.1 CRTAC1 family protein [Alteromonas sp. KUL49]GEA13679.1 hypothetical protein KUL49_40540 [Alteromonas sp. KUL49]